MGTGAVSGHIARDTKPVDAFSSSSSLSHNNNNNSSTNGSIHRSRGSTPQSSMPGQTVKMSCEMCSIHFTFFKRKKFCTECHRYFCSTCLPKPPSSSNMGRQCSKCRLLISGRFTRDDLQEWKVKDMRCFLDVRNISTKGCREKHDLIELVVTHFCNARSNLALEQLEHDVLVQGMAARMRNVSFENGPPSQSQASNSTGPADPQMPSEPGSEPSQSVTGSGVFVSQTEAEGVPGIDGAAEPRDSEEGEGAQQFDSTQFEELLAAMERIQEVFRDQAGEGDGDGEGRTAEQTDDTESSPAPASRRAQLSDITVEGDIGELTIRQLKELLVNNFVDYRGCCEKAELVVRVKRLWRDNLENVQRAEQIHLEDEKEAQRRAASSIPDADLSTSVQPSSGEAAKDDPPQSTLPSSETAPPLASASSTSSIPATEAAATSEPADSSAPVAESFATSPPAGLDPDRGERTDSLCRICMDALADCLLLECGHMVTCTQCGKRLADCPICRQYISRVVRVFRS